MTMRLLGENVSPCRLAEDSDFVMRVHLIRSGIPYDAAFGMSRNEAMAFSVVFGELDGQKFDWSTQKWDNGPKSSRSLEPAGPAEEQVEGLSTASGVFRVDGAAIAETLRKRAQRDTFVDHKPIFATPR